MPKPFYGFGNYLTDEGKMLGSTIVFVMADDAPAARQLLVKELSAEGDLVPNSLKVHAGDAIPSAWLLAAVMESKEAAWSSGIPELPAMRIAATRKKEYLS